MASTSCSVVETSAAVSQISVVENHHNREAYAERKNHIQHEQRHQRLRALQVANVVLVGRRGNGAGLLAEQFYVGKLHAGFWTKLLGYSVYKGVFISKIRGGVGKFRTLWGESEEVS